MAAKVNVHLCRRNMTIENTIIQFPSVAKGSTYSNINSTNYTVPVDSSQGYLLVLANPNNVTVDITYQYIGLASTSTGSLHLEKNLNFYFITVPGSLLRFCFST